MRILRRKPKRRTILVMDLVDVLVQGAPVQQPVGPVMERVLHDEEDRDLPGHGLPCGEGDVD
jgi:hypothetical protein